MHQTSSLGWSITLAFCHLRRRSRFARIRVKGVPSFSSGRSGWKVISEVNRTSGRGDIVEFGSGIGVDEGETAGVAVGISTFPSAQSIRTLDFRSQGRPKMTSSSPISVMRKSTHCVLSSIDSPSRAKWVILPAWFRVPSMLNTFMGVRRGKVRIRFPWTYFWLMKSAVAPLSTIAATSAVLFCPLKVTGTRKWDEVGSISRVYDIVQEKIESY